MDKYMYRAKRIDNGEWVYGYYFERKDTMGNIISASYNRSFLIRLLAKKSSINLSQ